jgi:tRNA-dihydrouridine synthase B
MFSWSSLPRPIIALAPMSGYTDTPFRRMVKEIAPSVVCFNEFTNTEGILRNNKTSMRQIHFDLGLDRPAVVQIFGNKPESFVQTAQMLAKLGVDAIDINMGCPARKVVGSDNGSALLKNITLAEKIVSATVKGLKKAKFNIPVSVKMRIGTAKYDSEKFLDFAERIQNAGASLITVHGRTAKQMYSGTADWDPIYELKSILKIPVIGNGDIKSGKDAVKRLKNLDGVMVGRAALGNPWIFTEIVAAFEGKTYKEPTFEEKLPLIKKHLDLSVELKGEKWGILEMRKHLAHYIRGIPHASELRQRIMVAVSKEEIIEILSSSN